MKKFFEDYMDLCKHSCRFMKEHWMGYLVFCAGVAAAELIYLNRDEIVEAVKEKLP